MQDTAGTLLGWNWDLVSSWDSSQAGPFWSFAQVVTPITFRTMTDFSPGSSAASAFDDHYKLVRRVTPNRRLLEFRVQERWEPLCAFLGVRAPDDAFPRYSLIR
jgi:hypothetical protein